MKQWRKGGMTSNGLRRSGEVRNHFNGPGRQNIIPDAVSSNNNKTDNPAFKEPVSSIGYVQTNGLGQVASGSQGPGTLKSTNIETTTQNVLSSDQIGYVMQNDKKTQFVNYRWVDPTLVENLRQNPLSIYAVGDVKNREIPAFFTYVRPEDYETYKSIPEVDISPFTKELTIDGSPNVSILGLGYQNPLMGITTGIPVQKPEFLGKTYGGMDGTAEPYAEKLYDTTWRNNFNEKPKGNFDERCQNKALMEFSQGYNVAEQLLDNRMIEWVGKGYSSVDNIPWGPKEITGNPITQQGGIWNGPSTTLDTQFGYENSRRIQLNINIPSKNVNPYKYGLPGTLVAG